MCIATKLHNLYQTCARQEGSRAAARCPVDRRWLCPKKAGQEGGSKKRKRCGAITRCGGKRRRTGAGQLVALLQNLDTFAMQPNAEQRKIQRAAVASMLPFIFRNEPETAIRRARVEHQLPEPRQLVWVSMPRRFGKTVVSAQCVAAYAASVPGSQTGVFSTCQRTSELFLMAAKECIKEIPNVRVIECNKERILLAVDGGVSEVRCYPGNAEKLRGVGATYAVIDEFAFTSQAVLQEAIYPILEVGTTSSLAISTPQAVGHPASDLLDRVEADSEDKDSCFRVIRVMGACKACIETLDDPTQCPHVDLPRPRWKCAVKQKALGVMYGSNTDMLAQESYGISVNKGGNLFEKIGIKRLMDVFHPTPVVEEADNVFIAIDPTGGGGSDFAMASGVRVKGRVTVVGLESVATCCPKEISNVILVHLRRLRELYPYARMVVMPESNLGLEAARIGHLVQDLPNTVCVKGSQRLGGDVSWGYLTTSEVKSGFVAITTSMLANEVSNCLILYNAC